MVFGRRKWWSDCDGSVVDWASSRRFSRECDHEPCLHGVAVSTVGDVPGGCCVLWICRPAIRAGALYGSGQQMQFVAPVLVCF